MTLSKQTKTDKIETVAIENHYVLQCRDKIFVMEDDVEISSSFHRYVLNPNIDISAITDATVLAQFNAVMTDEVKQNYQTFLESQNAEMNSDLESQNAEMNSDLEAQNVEMNS